MNSQKLASRTTQIPSRGSAKRVNKKCGVRHRTRCWWRIAVVFILSISQVACGTPGEFEGFSIDYKNPSLHWMTRLEGEQMFHGNAIVQSPYNSNILYATTHSGKLLALSLENGSTIASVSVQPKVVTEDSGEETWTMHCSAGISFGELVDGGKFLVYAVQDTPPEGSVYTPKTRVVAVSVPGHEVLWTSTGLPGEANGTPLVYANKGDSRDYVFLTHNSHFKNAIDNSTTKAGHVTLLQTVTGHVVWTDSEWSSGAIPKGYSAPGIVQSPDAGMFSGGLSNSNDVIMWSNNAEDGRGLDGFIFVFQLPMDYSGIEAQVEDLRTKPLKFVRWNAVVPPVFNKNGTHLFMGVGGSEMRGWVHGTQFDETASWSLSLIDAVSDPLAPVPTAPTLSIDEHRLFVASAETDLVCVDTRSGEKKWSIPGTSPFLARSKVSPDDHRVYVIQSVDGRVFSHDQRTGDLNWLASCDRFEEDCANSVRADFELSYTGQYLIYGDVMGRIIALKLGDLVEKVAPTAAPTAGALDTSGGLMIPPENIIWPEDEEADDNESRSSSALGVSIFLIILATIVAIGSLAYILFMNSLKTAPHPMQDPQIADDETESSSDYSLPSDPDNAPDKYEDTMISQHKAPEQTSFHLRSLVSTPNDNFQKSESSLDAMSFAPSDRISLLLGTNNRIAPIQEDFSYGASVLV